MVAGNGAGAGPGTAMGAGTETRATETEHENEDGGGRGGRELGNPPHHDRNRVQVQDAIQDVREGVSISREF